MKTKNDIGLMERDTQGLLGILIGITPENEDERIKQFVDKLGCLAVDIELLKYKK